MKKTNGFTLVELIVVILLIGILSVVAVSRFANSSVFSDRANSDKVEFLLKMAQKTSVGQRRNVYVIKNGTQLNLCYQNTTPCLAAQSVLLNGTPYFIDIGSTTITLPGPLLFNSLGNTGTAKLTIPVGTKNIYVETESGYIHE